MSIFANLNLKNAIAEALSTVQASLPATSATQTDAQASFANKLHQEMNKSSFDKAPVPQHTEFKQASADATKSNTAPGSTQANSQTASNQVAANQATTAQNKLQKQAQQQTHDKLANSDVDAQQTIATGTLLEAGDPKTDMLVDAEQTDAELNTDTTQVPTINTLGDNSWIHSMIVMRGQSDGALAKTESDQTSLLGDSDKGLLNQQPELGLKADALGVGRETAQAKLGTQDALVTQKTTTDSDVDASFDQLLGQQLTSPLVAGMNAGAGISAETFKLAAQAQELKSADQNLLALSQTSPQNAMANLSTTAFATELAASNATTATIEVPFGQAAWQQAINKQVVAMTNAGDDVATLTLSPPDLGPVQVVLKIDQSSVDTTFISDNPNVRQALEDGMQDLKDRMASQGLQLGNAFVGTGEQAQKHFSMFQPQAQSTSNLRGNAAGELTPEISPEATAIHTKVLGLVDTFV